MGLCQEMDLRIQSYVLTQLRYNSSESREAFFCWDTRARLFVKTNVRGEIRIVSSTTSNVEVLPTELPGVQDGPIDCPARGKPYSIYKSLRCVSFKYLESAHALHASYNACVFLNRTLRIARTQHALLLLLAQQAKTASPCLVSSQTHTNRTLR